MFKHVRTFILFSISSVLLSGCALFLQNESPTDQQITKELLKSSVALFQDELRDPVSGQYYDAISLRRSLEDQPPPKATPLQRRLAMEAKARYQNSSVAATGMGLVVLALGDALGIQENADGEARKTLEFIAGYKDPLVFTNTRSKQGWFRHWFDATTGKDNEASYNDGFSTIDTAILVAGAQLAASHFESQNTEEADRVRELADELLYSVEWESAIANLETGKLYLNYDRRTEKALGQTAVFNEYILVASLGAYKERRQGIYGPMTEFWNKHYRSPANLPRVDYQGISLLTDHPNHFLSHFAIQFSMFLSADVSRSPEYLTYIKNAEKADRLWFQTETGQSRFWGMGAGEVRYKDPKTKKLVKSYKANGIDRNSYLVVSPAIMAGFLPVSPEGRGDLTALYREKKCFYNYKSAAYRAYPLLWRCSMKNNLPFDRLQAIDFSTFVLGLASLEPEINGLEFFSKHAPYIGAVDQLPRAQMPGGAVRTPASF